ncbi:MAG: phosphopantetheine adenylyltransferase [Halobacteriaceae archaeon]
MHVALGGTFDPVHDGHRALFRRAFAFGDVTVGLTTDDLAPETRRESRTIRSYDRRRSDLAAELADFASRADREVEIRPLEAPTDIAVEPPFDVLVVSPETRPAADRINEIRRDRGLAALRIEVVPHVLAADGERISSTRIVRGEIDEHGTLTPERAGRQVE